MTAPVIRHQSKRFNDCPIQWFNKSIQLFNFSTLQRNLTDSTIARFNGLTNLFNFSTIQLFNRNNRFNDLTI